ncbi:MAG: hypothetical protein ACFE8B_01010 [Candidatus Hermodarchaeota archaeon]
MNIDWSILQSGWDIIWEDPIGWFLELPLLTQILLIIGILALLIGVIILVYYILKGVAYLLYYLFKGLYYLFKGIFVGLYKLFEALYYAISGKPKKEKKILTPVPEHSPIPIQQNLTHYEIDQAKIPSYCTECGYKLTESMQSLLISRGIAFCFKCGMQFELKAVDNPNF